MPGQSTVVTPKCVPADQEEHTALLSGTCSSSELEGEKPMQSFSYSSYVEEDAGKCSIKMGEQDKREQSQSHQQENHTDTALLMDSSSS